MTGDFGILSLIPTLLVLVIAIYTKKVIEPLLIGAVLGFILTDGINFIGGLENGVYSVFQGPTLGMIVCVTLLFGIFIELLEKSKAASVFSSTIGQKVKSAKSSLFATWFLGIVLFIDDFLNAIVVGTTMRKTTDKYGVPREMLAYVVDVTAGPMAVMLPFSAWAVFFMSMFTELDIPKLTGLTEFQIYWHTIPFIFYAIIAISIVPLAILGIIKPLGPMKNAYENVKKTIGDEVSKENESYGKVRPYHFILPILVLVIVTFISNGNVVQGATVALIITILLFSIQKLLTGKEIRQCVKNGIINMLPVTGVIFFSLLLVEANVKLGTTEFIIDVASPYISGNLLPVISFLLVSVMAFTTGSFFGTSAIVMPIIIPMAIVNDSNIFLVLGAVISGAVFGSHCCFFGDASVLTSTACEISPLRHGLTQLPYGLISCLISAILYLVLGFTM